MPMPYKRRRKNPEFTTDEAQTATLIVTEGSFRCKEKLPTIRIGMCQKGALEPASRVFGTKIFPARTRKRILCKPEDFPPDGRGYWAVETAGRRADYHMERLKPLIPHSTYKKWQETKARCPPPAKRKVAIERLLRTPKRRIFDQSMANHGLHNLAEGLRGKNTVLLANKP